MENYPTDTALTGRRPRPYRPRIDGRSAPARRAKLVLAELVMQLGGSEYCAEVEGLLDQAERTAALIVVAEVTRARAMSGVACLDDLIRCEHLADLTRRRLLLAARPEDKPELIVTEGESRTLSWAQHTAEGGK